MTLQLAVSPRRDHLPKAFDGLLHPRGQRPPAHVRDVGLELIRTLGAENDAVAVPQRRVVHDPAHRGLLRRQWRRRGVAGRLQRPHGVVHGRLVEEGDVEGKRALAAPARALELRSRAGAGGRAGLRCRGERHLAGQEAAGERAGVWLVHLSVARVRTVTPRPTVAAPAHLYAKKAQLCFRRSGMRSASNLRKRAL